MRLAAGMETQQKQLCFVDGPFTCIDLEQPGTGRGVWSKETLEEMRKRYPNAELVELDDWTEAKEQALCTEPKPIDEERFLEMLEVLPPQRWQRGVDCESFELCEHTSGRVTTIFCRFGCRFFEYQGLAGQTLQQHAQNCAQVKG